MSAKRSEISVTLQRQADLMQVFAGYAQKGGPLESLSKKQIDIGDAGLGLGFVARVLVPLAEASSDTLTELTTLLEGRPAETNFKIVFRDASSDTQKLAQAVGLLLEEPVQTRQKVLTLIEALRLKEQGPRAGLDRGDAALIVKKVDEKIRPATMEALAAKHGKIPIKTKPLRSPAELSEGPSAKPAASTQAEGPQSPKILRVPNFS